jgi:hypothetical protein
MKASMNGLVWVLTADWTTSCNGLTPKPGLMSRLPRLAAAVSLLWAPLAQPQAQSASALSSHPSTVIVNAQVADGTGRPLMPANVRIHGDRIVKAGAWGLRAGGALADAAGGDSQDDLTAGAAARMEGSRHNP